MKELISKIKHEYYNCSDSNIMNIAIIILMFPYIILGDSKHRIVRLLGLILGVIWAISSSPIGLPLLLIGFFQFVWQNI
jgi:hypothetical protein